VQQVLGEIFKHNLHLWCRVRLQNISTEHRASIPLRFWASPSRRSS
jgi:hypothetical protein